MHSAPHLLNEDRQDFARVLDEALRSASHRQDLRNRTAAGSTLTTEQLRGIALSATSLIAAAAAAEYQHYVKLRSELRTPLHAATRPPRTRTRTTRAARTSRAGPESGAGRGPDAEPVSDAAPGLDTAQALDATQALDARRGADGPDSERSPDTVRGAGAVGGSGAAGGSGTVRGPGRDRAGVGDRAPVGAEPGEPAGAGLAAVLAVLAPVLAGAAALIFLLVGYALKMVGPASAFADTLLTTGWVFGAITAAAILVAAVGLLVTALRNSATSLRAGDRAELDAEVNRAREAWHQALLERGMLPFLQEALLKSGGDRTRTTRTQPTGRMPHLGYHSPGFSSPDGGSTAASRPRYSSPDFSSPDFGGPEHQPE